MEFLAGVMTVVCMGAMGYAGFILGQKSKRPTATQANEEERKKADRMRQGFEQLMSYDVTTALKGKRVD